MKIRLKKLYRGMVDLRDYNVKKCIDNRENMYVEYDGKTMTLSPYQLVSNVMSRSTSKKSKIGGDDYYLLGYEWNPDPVTL